jgi:hypothetical protein
MGTEGEEEALNPETWATVPLVLTGREGVGGERGRWRNEFLG